MDGMTTIWLLSSCCAVDGLFDTFALNDNDLRQIALDNYWAATPYGVHVEVRPPGAPNKVRITEGGLVMAEYHIFKIHRVIR